ncbi:MAG: hypothetical protein ACRDP8_08720 [Actinopolymorphaceae bacterium]
MRRVGMGGVVARYALAGAVAVGLGIALTTPTAAHASCAGPAAPSADAFRGTVIATEDAGHTGTVVVESGEQVTVEGGQSGASSARRFAVGAFYEFHPTNTTSPYAVNGCTATRRLWGPRPAPVEPHKDVLPAWLPVDEQAGPPGYGLLLASVVLLVLAIGAGLGMTRQRRWGREF